MAFDCATRIVKSEQFQDIETLYTGLERVENELIKIRAENVELRRENAQRHNQLSDNSGKIQETLQSMSEGQGGNGSQFASDLKSMQDKHVDSLFDMQKQVNQQAQKGMTQEQRIEQIESMVFEQTRNVRHIAEEIQVFKQERLAYAGFPNQLKQLQAFMEEQRSLHHDLQELQKRVQEQQLNLAGGGLGPQTPQQHAFADLFASPVKEGQAALHSPRSHISDIDQLVDPIVQEQELRSTANLDQSLEKLESSFPLDPNQRSLAVVPENSQEDAASNQDQNQDQITQELHASQSSEIDLGSKPSPQPHDCLLDESKTSFEPEDDWRKNELSSAQEAGPDKKLEDTSLEPEREEKLSPDDDLQLKSGFSGTCGDRYAFRESVWDATVFVYAGQYSACTSVLVIFLVVLTIVAQALLTFIIASEFTGSNFDDENIQAFQSFHTMSAQTPGGQVGSVSSGSLVSSLVPRVCGTAITGQLPASIVFRQQDALMAIDSYFPQGDNGSIFGESQGALMCVTCMLLWSMVVLASLKDMFELAHGILQLGRSTTSMSNANAVFKLESATRGRRMFILTMTMFRLFFCISLWLSGLSFLAHTIDMEGLVLNAIALEFVLHIDSLVFRALAPLQVRKLFRNLEILPIMPKETVAQQVLLTTNVLVTLVVMVVAIVVWLLPEIDQLTKAGDALCGGEGSFKR